jgi:uncharacterized protein (TIGR03086 family)
MPVDQNLLDLYKSVSEWTASKVAGATDLLDAPTPCDDWDVRTLLNHMLDTQRYFQGVALGTDASLPSPRPPDLLGNDPVADIRQAQAKTVSAFEPEGVIDKTGPSLGIAFSDQLLHGWDLATATHQDATMPEGLPEAAYEQIHGAFTDEQRKGVFKPEVDPGPNPSMQDKLLAYTGRNPR